MTYKEILLQEIETASDEVLAEAIDFIRFLKTKPATHMSEQSSALVENFTSEQTDDPRAAFSTFLADLKQLPLQRAEPLQQETKGKDLSKFVGTWQGNDLEDCLHFVRETRSQSEF
ncbi:MAG: hypothetical protein J0L70_30900 [Leptolyngbya sp. UWPOB_LEPTO1]|uniref:hypothetical protein n=1 Tax=Leptolyngbya sp. UWPOB_LEPTO1 TaxID=2815653 RepID=UPI001AD4F380|nr:hypothetical protein [Leptolyngbya sp. UWPOB_LEPTO1]MBN8564926.1 hypothetical protein [Leptolyngbya sp. UWPOB_LEPTO1]